MSSEYPKDYANIPVHKRVHAVYAAYRESKKIAGKPFESKMRWLERCVLESATYRHCYELPAPGKAKRG